jgi:formylglycine-generating enzyme required for sulfatase activity
LSEVTLSSYRIGETEVTQALWRAVMGDNPSETKCDECPVTNVSWEDAKAFVHQMTKLTGKTYDLPTEAQWEYAARGGQTTISHPGKVDRYAWHLGNSENTLHQVGQKLTNGLGLSDMLGGVWEMCSDWYGPYTNTPKIVPHWPADHPTATECCPGTNSKASDFGLYPSRKRNAPVPWAVEIMADNPIGQTH